MRRWCALRLTAGEVGVPTKNEKRWIVSYDRHDSLDYEKVREHIAAKQAMAKLDPRQCDIIKMYHLKSLTFGQIGEELSLSKERVRQLLLKGMEKVRSELTGIRYRPIPKRKKKSLDRTQEKA